MRAVDRWLTRRVLRNTVTSSGKGSFMGRLQVILDAANEAPSCDNRTILDTDQFHTVRGPSSRVFRDRLDAALSGSEDLARVHQRNTDDGLEVIEPVRAGIHGGYWYLRSVTRGAETFPAGEQRYKPIADALDALPTASVDNSGDYPLQRVKPHKETRFFRNAETLGNRLSI